MYKKVLITGAKGMLGTALCGALDSFYKVIAIDQEECDITHREETKETIGSLAIDAAVHCAAYTDVDKAEDEREKVFAVNVQGTKNVCESLKNEKCLFVYISTDYVFDGQKNGAYTELDQPHPLSVYGQSKLEGEKFAAKFKEYLILRTSWLFGPDGKNFVATILRLAKEKQILEVVDDQVGSPTYTLDLAQGIKAVLDIYFTKGLNYGIYNVTNSGKCSWFEFAEYIIKSAGLKTTLEAISSSKLACRAKRPLNSQLSNNKFISLTGEALRPWQEATKHYIDNYLTPRRVFD
jgi:dTDP-4-dehydrorhamnose reductase